MKDNNLNLAELSKVDELSVRKILVERMLNERKKQLADEIMLILAKSVNRDVEEIITGTVVFLERWLKDIDIEIENVLNTAERTPSIEQFSNILNKSFKKER